MRQPIWPGGRLLAVADLIDWSTPAGPLPTPPGNPAASAALGAGDRRRHAAGGRHACRGCRHRRARHAQLPCTDPADPMDAEFLAAGLEVAGGDIRKIVLAAAYDAVAAHRLVGMRDMRGDRARDGQARADGPPTSAGPTQPADRRTGVQRSWPGTVPGCVAARLGDPLAGQAAEGPRSRPEDGWCHPPRPSDNERLAPMPRVPERSYGRSCARIPAQCRKEDDNAEYGTGR